jgi:hypothetical protein
MDSDRRHAAVVALVELGRSQRYRDRADAGHGLAGFAEEREARRPLLELVLDRGATFVTRVTAEAVLRGRDRIGLAIVASALVVADWSHSDRSPRTARYTSDTIITTAFQAIDPQVPRLQR